MTRTLLLVALLPLSASPSAWAGSLELTRAALVDLPAAVAQGGEHLLSAVAFLNQPGIRLDDPQTARALVDATVGIFAQHGVPDLSAQFNPPQDAERLGALNRAALAVLGSKLGQAVAQENPVLFSAITAARAKIQEAMTLQTISDVAASWQDSPNPFDPVVKDGTAHVTVAYDVGYSVDLVRASGLLAGAAPSPLQHTGPAPSYFNFKPAPLRILRETGAEHSLDKWKSLSAAEVVLYEIGVIQVTYQIPFSGKLSELAKLSELLHENKTLLSESRRLVATMVAELGAAVVRPVVAEACEDYVVFQIRRFAESGSLERLFLNNPRAVAQILRADPKLTSPQEVEDALSTKVSYSDGDVAVPDWAAALVVDPDGRDVRAVLEFAIVQLLEMRLLDARLDDELATERRKFMSGKHKAGLFFRAGDTLDHIGELLIEGAMIKEGIDNALKLIGDQYLARLYEQAAKRYHLSAWSENVKSKLATLESIHDKMEQAHSTNHQMRLEWIVIVLILVEIVVAVLPFILQLH